MIVINPPTPFDGRPAWEQFLAEMKRLQEKNPTDQNVAEMVSLATLALTSGSGYLTD